MVPAFQRCAPNTTFYILWSYAMISYTDYCKNKIQYSSINDDRTFLLLTLKVRRQPFRATPKNINIYLDN